MFYCLTQKDSVTFNVWDIGGPASMSTVNQCFFTDKALYVVIWNLALGQEAVTNLQTWLLNIEVSILYTHEWRKPTTADGCDQNIGYNYTRKTE